MEFADQLEFEIADGDKIIDCLLKNDLRISYRESVKKPLDEIDVADLGIEAGPMIRELAYAPPEGRQRGVTVEDVSGLVAALKDKGLV